MSEKLYMNIKTGSVDTANGWNYTDENGANVDPVALGDKDLVEVVRDSCGDYIEV
jgi:hypothetical protein